MTATEAGSTLQTLLSLYHLLSALQLMSLILLGAMNVESAAAG